MKQPLVVGAGTNASRLGLVSAGTPANDLAMKKPRNLLQVDDGKNNILFKQFEDSSSKKDLTKLNQNKNGEIDVKKIKMADLLSPRKDSQQEKTV